MSHDLHSNPFTEETRTKLLIFQYYLKEWLPVFLARKNIIWKNINIIDFFAGPGYDIENNDGSPLLIIKELNNYVNQIKSNEINVNLVFNEYSVPKYNKLQEILERFKNQDHYKLTIENLDFSIAFEKYYKDLKCKNSANLLFLDQSGIKQITEEIFLKITSCHHTDFIFFISSSTIKRFSDHSSVQKYFDLSVEEIKNTPYHKIHKIILDFYKNLIPQKEYFLAPFSIKKGSNIYGLIFGSHHILGTEKFLTTVWKIDPERGEANFDIDGENLIENQFDLFTGETEKPKKVELFEEDLIENIKSKKLINNKDVYIYTITQGFLSKHARQILKELKDQGVIQNNKINLSYEVFNDPSKIVNIKIG